MACLKFDVCVSLEFEVFVYLNGAYRKELYPKKILIENWIENR